MPKKHHGAPIPRKMRQNAAQHPNGIRRAKDQKWQQSQPSRQELADFALMMAQGMYVTSPIPEPVHLQGVTRKTADKMLGRLSKSGLKARRIILQSE